MTAETPPTAVTTTRQVRDPGAPARVVEAAWRAVAETGSQGATMRAIAAEAGVTTGAVTHYFADKRTLMDEVMRHNNDRALRRVRAAVGSKRGLAAARAAYEAVLPLDAERRREWQVWIAAWTEAVHNNELAPALRVGWRWWRDLLAEMLQQALDDGELARQVDTAGAAERMLPTLAGLGLMAAVEPPRRLRATARRILELEFGALTGPASDSV